MNNRYFRNIALTGVVGLALAVCVVIRSMAPMAVLPKLDIPNMVLLSLVALVVEYYIQPRNKRCYICIPVLSALTFGLLPAVAGVIAWAECWKFALVGGVVFTVTTFLYSSMEDRLASGPKAHAAAIISAVCLFLAAQIFAGMIL